MELSLVILLQLVNRFVISNILLSPHITAIIIYQSTSVIFLSVGISSTEHFAATAVLTRGRDNPRFIVSWLWAGSTTNRSSRSVTGKRFYLYIRVQIGCLVQYWLLLAPPRIYRQEAPAQVSLHMASQLGRLPS